MAGFDESLLALYGDGLSYTEMAKLLGVGRGMVSGRIWRLGLSDRQHGINPRGKLQDYARRGTGQREVVPKPRGQPYNPAKA